MTGTTRPVPGSARPYDFPRFESVYLANGLEIVTASVKRLPLVSIRLVVNAGARLESTGLAGVATVTARALAEGTLNLGATALAEEFERLGGTLESEASWDASQAATTIMSGRFEPTFRLLSEVIREPAFSPREVERIRQERLSELMELESEPRGLAEERFNGMLFKKSSRFHLPEGGAADTVKSLTVDHCREWHRTRFLPSATTAIVCGDIDPEKVVAVIGSTLGSWEDSAVPEVTPDDSPACLEPGVRVIHRADAPQTELRVGHVGLPRSHPDYFAAVLMNAILGGVFNSRINLSLRERHGFTYGASSYFDWRRDAGAFTVSTAVATGVTAPAVNEIVTELLRMREAPPSQDELSLCASFLEGVFPIRFETTGAIASALASHHVLGLPADYFETYRSRIRAITVDDVWRVARDHLHTDRLQILAVGDSDVIAPALRALDAGPVSIESTHDA